MALAAAYDSTGYAVVGPVLPGLRDRAGASSLEASLIYATLEGSLTLLFSDRLSQTGLAVLIAAATLGAGAGALLPVTVRGPREGRVTARAGTVACGTLALAAVATGSPLGWFLLLPAAAFALGAGEAAALELLAGIPEEGLITAMVGNAQAWGFLVAPPLSTWLAQVAGRTAPGAALAVAGLAVALLGGLAVPPRGSATVARSTGP